MSLDLDVDSPEKVPQVLRRAADRFRESTGELQSAWQDEHAGKVWTAIATILDRAASSCEKAIENHLG
jgi:hypothetical protein